MKPIDVPLLVGTSLFVLALTVAIPVAERRLFNLGRLRRGAGLGVVGLSRVFCLAAIQLALVLLGAVAFCAAWFSLLASFLIAPWEILWPCAAALAVSGVFGVAASISLFFKPDYQRFAIWTLTIVGLSGFVIVFIRSVNS